MKSSVKKLWRRAYELESELYSAFSDSGAEILWHRGSAFPEMGRDSRGRYIRPRYIHVIASIPRRDQESLRVLSRKLDYAHLALHRAGQMVRYPSARAIRFIDDPVERISVSISDAYKVCRVPAEGYFTIMEGRGADYRQQVVLLERAGIRARVVGGCELQIRAEDINPDDNMNMRKVSGRRYLASAYIDGRVRIRHTVGWWVLPFSVPVFDCHASAPGRWPVRTFELPIVTPWEFRYRSSSGSSIDMEVLSSCR